MTTTTSRNAETVERVDTSGTTSLIQQVHHTLDTHQWEEVRVSDSSEVERHANEHESGRVGAVTPTAHISILDIPPEILFMIMRHILPPTWILRGIRELTPGSPHIADLAAKSTFALVCKIWNQVATDLLYSDVHLRSIGQVVAFSRALETPRALGQLVRQLHLICFVPRGYKEVFSGETRRILDNCPLLVHFMYAGQQPTDPALEWTGNDTLSALPPMPSSLTSLEFTADVAPELFIPVIAEVCAVLQTLRVPFRVDLHQQHPHYPRLDFPVMEELHIVIWVPTGIGPSLADSERSKKIWDWTMPSLRRLWLSCPGSEGLLVQQIMPAWSTYAPQFLALYGKKLVFLSLHVGCMALHTPIPIAAACPRLTHLAVTTMSPGRAGGYTPEYEVIGDRHPRVEHLDVWCRWNTSACVEWGSDENPDPDFHEPVELDVPIFDKLKGGFPSLRTYRVLDGTFVHLDRLPLDFPPGPQDDIALQAQAQDDDSDRIPAWSAAIQAHIHPKAVFSYFDLESWASDDDELDSDYCDESNTDDWNWSSGGSDSVIDEDEIGVEAELDREEALAVFRQVLDARADCEYESDSGSNRGSE
ncbi:F-box domain-containing protein [Mycena chlorophos]|uniref:F-box domain-containing protein n=1 Tax=Mycena chlorophos TaxID=658473 RepID=A0A8H6SU54_MYCCL|nr:F-box domain-containing protein [Mycena chlorophos]